MAAPGPKLTITRGVFRGGRADFAAATRRDTLSVQFNPAEYAQNVANSYAEAAIPGLQAPLIQFGRGEAETLSLELLLDTYAYGGGEDIRDAALLKLESFMAIDGELHAPPPCRVVWGSLVFVGVMTELQRRFVLFREDGRPVRARVQLGFKAYVPVAVQVRAVPRASPDRRKLWLVREGDRLDRISFDLFGDVAHWRTIAAANRIDDPLDLPPGLVLRIPALAPGAEP